ncbi:MAG: GMP synthase [Thermoplasmata archaeon HGW-Thermoplasmata-1]|nr:MAG: GMP synthase [Thermoplasmata archaeon HGW-Thermoplasmata-1]
MALKVYVVDNGGQWTHREWRVLKYLDVETKIVPNTTPFSELEADGIDGMILSGGAPRIGLTGELGNCGEYLEKARFPILGICAGHQFMARFFGGDCAPGEVPEFGKIDLVLDGASNPIIEGLPETSIVWESHNDEVTVVPQCFEVLAHSENCKVQIMAHRELPFYGMQFHPEVEHTQFGERMFKNFLEICIQKGKSE